MFATGESSFALFGDHTLLCSEIVFYYLNGVVTYFDHYVSKTSTIALTGSYYLYASSISALTVVAKTGLHAWHMAISNHFDGSNTQTDMTLSCTDEISTLNRDISSVGLLLLHLYGDGGDYFSMTISLEFLPPTPYDEGIS